MIKNCDEYNLINRNKRKKKGEKFQLVIMFVNLYTEIKIKLDKSRRLHFVLFAELYISKSDLRSREGNLQHKCDIRRLQITYIRLIRKKEFLLKIATCLAKNFWFKTETAACSTRSFKR